MARDLSDALEKSLDGTYDSDDEVASRADEGPKRGFLDFTAKSGAVAGAGAVVLLAVGLFVGASFLGGPDGDSSGQRRGVTAVTERLPVFDQLESMRENTISTLNQQVEDLSAQAGSGSSAAAAAAAVGSVRGQQTSAAEDLIGMLVDTQASADDADAYLKGSYEGDAGDEMVSLGFVYGPDAERPTPELSGSSPAADTGKVCKLVSRPVLSVVSLTAGPRSVDGSVCVAYAPVATDDSQLHNAVYVLGFVRAGGSSDGSMAVASCRYVGLVGEGEAGSLQDAVNDAASGVSDALA